MSRELSSPTATRAYSPKGLRSHDSGKGQQGGGMELVAIVETLLHQNPDSGQNVLRNGSRNELKNGPEYGPEYRPVLGPVLIHYSPLPRFTATAC